MKIEKKFLLKNYPIIRKSTNNENIYNPDFKKYFNSLNTKDYLELAKKIAEDNTKIFRHMYIEEKIDGQTEYQDLMQDGALSCASFISNVLFYYKQISSPSATVTSTIKKLENGPRKNILYKESLKTINDIPRGAILIRANKKKGERQEFFVADYHLGFYLGNNKAISNVVTDKEHKIKSIAIHDAIRTAPKFDHYDKIEIVSYFIPKE